MAKKKKLTTKQINTRNNSIFLSDEIKKIDIDEEFDFQCSLCGECCREVKESVGLESLDIFRIFQYFSRNNPLKAIEEILVEYATLVPITDFGFPVFFLNTIGVRDECIFLKSGRCSIQEAKPKTCRVYPLSVIPNDTINSFDLYLISQKPHHLKHNKILVSEWMDKNFTSEDQEFTLRDSEVIMELGGLMSKLQNKGVYVQHWLYPFIYYKYLNYQTNLPFMSQYKENIATIKNILTDLLMY